MATAIPHNDVTGKSNDYGLGRVSGYLAHWSHTNNDGWSTHWFDGGINSFGFAYGDITVPRHPAPRRRCSPGTSRRPAPGRAGPSPTTWTCGSDHNDRTAATRAARVRGVRVAFRHRQRRVRGRQQPAGRQLPAEGRAGQRPDLPAALRHDRHDHPRRSDAGHDRRPDAAGDEPRRGLHLRGEDVGLHTGLRGLRGPDSAERCIPPG